MVELSFEDLMSVSGGAGDEYMKMKLSKLKSEFIKACKSKRMDRIMPILNELQARGQYAWAKEVAASYGITSI